MSELVESVDSAPDTPLHREEALRRYSNGATPLGGRKSDLTDEVATSITEAVANGSYTNTACAAAGVSVSAAAEWARRGVADGQAGLDTRYSRFAEGLARAEAACEQRLAATLARGGDGKFSDWRAQAFILERRYRDRWAEPKEAPNQGVTIIVTADLAEQLRDAMAVAAATHVIDVVATSSTSDLLPGIEQGQACTDPAQSKG